jgi:hypothetical protein
LDEFPEYVDRKPIMGRRAHQPDPCHRRQVEGMAAYGIPEADIAAILAIDPKTLRKYYRSELDFGSVKANAQVAGFLFNSAKNGNVTAQIFWLKTRARWRESPTDINHSGAVGVHDYSGYSDEQITDFMELIMRGSPEVLERLKRPPDEAEKRLALSAKAYAALR